MANAFFPLTPRDAARITRHAAASDAAATLHPAQQALIHHRGWLRMLAPRACGGTELTLPQAVRLQEALAHADGSVAWVVTLCAGAGWFAGFLPPDLAREVMATRRVCLAGSGAPSGVADVEGEGYRISGQWAHASGAPLATHFTMNAVLREGGVPLLDEAGAPRVRAFIVPASAVEIVPSWQSIGLRASASHSYRIEGAWVPALHGFTISAAAATAGGPLYRFPFVPLAFVTLAANVAGMARHFVELAGPLVLGRKHLLTGALLGESPEVRARLGDAGRRLGAAWEGLLDALDSAWATVEAYLPLEPAEELRLQNLSLALVQAARAAVDGLYPLCGLQAAHAGTEINRVWRDFHTATQHGLLVPDLAGQDA